MASSSAAELQRKHALEGSPDPFPSLRGSPLPSKLKAPGKDNLDTGSESAFPSLGPSPGAKPPAATSSWATASPRIKAALTTPLFTDTFSLSSLDLVSAGKSSSLGDVMKSAMVKYKVKVEASTQKKPGQTTGQTTFFIKGESEREVEKAKRSLVASLSPTVTITVEAPVSTIPSIIGTKGANLKQIRDQTSTKIDIPRRDGLAPPTGNGNGSSHPSTRAPSPQADDEDEPTVTITIQGSSVQAQEAKVMISAIISSKRAPTTQRVRDIPSYLLPFLSGRQEEIRAAAGEGDAGLYFDFQTSEASATGDREAVGKVLEKVKATISALQTELNSVKISLPKRQHHLLAGSGADLILEQTRCVVVISQDTSDEIAVWGRPIDLGPALGAVMAQAQSQYTTSFDLPAPAAPIFAYLNYTSVGKTLTATHSGVRVHAPKGPVESTARVSIDFAGEKASVDAAVKQLADIVQKVKGSVKEIEIDWLAHKILDGKHSKKLKHFKETEHVTVYFPPESAESSKVLLFCDHGAVTNGAERTKHLQTVSAELLKLAQEVADVKTETISVDKKWHAAIVGKGGSTINAIIGEDKALSIKVGAEARAASVDVIVIRGLSAEVDKATGEIQRLVEQAKNDEIDSSYSLEFEINREYIGRVVGTQGSGVNKLREQLDVKIDFADDEKDTIKKGKATSVKSKVKITGRKENAEEAKKRILNQVEKMADETSETLRIPRQFHASLIGPSGKYVTRLEDKHTVKITFPRGEDESGEGRTREPLKPDEVLIKGGKKGVAAAKAEIMDALDFEKETNNTIEFTVPTRSVARVLGKGGAVINEIKDTTDVSKIDIDKDESSTHSRITIRGTKTAIAEAKAAILAISDQVEEEVSVTIHVESKYHRTLIGAGGQGLKDLIIKCGGPADSRSQAGLVHFPRQGETADEVRIRGEPKLVAKVQAELEKVVAGLRDRVVLLVSIPAALHRALIGRGGQTLTDLQNKTGAQIQFPGSRSYNQVGEAQNAEEFIDADAATLVKVIGPKSACEQAIKAMQAVKAPPAPPAPKEVITATVTVPLKYFNAVSQQGAFFRQLRNHNVHVDHSTIPQQKSNSRPTPSGARIDDEVDLSQPQWHVVPNYQDAEEGDSEWTLKARDQTGLDEARKLLDAALENAANASHIGYLTMPDRAAFPRIVGTKGATVSRLRTETGADITVGRDDNTIIIVGTEEALQAAKDAIATIAARLSKRQEYDD